MEIDRAPYEKLSTGWRTGFEKPGQLIEKVKLNTRYMGGTERTKSVKLMLQRKRSLMVFAAKYLHIKMHTQFDSDINEMVKLFTAVRCLFIIKRELSYRWLKEIPWTDPFTDKAVAMRKRDHVRSTIYDN